MSLYRDNDGRFPDESDVEVHYPLTDEQSNGDRSTWAWVAGWISGQCGPDEWDVVVEGAGPNSYEANGELLYPSAFRDSSEIRKAGTR